MQIPANSQQGKSKYLSLLSIAALICISLLIRSDVYKMPHLRGDQRFYIGTAMKVKKEGIKGYSLRGIDLKPIDPFFVYFDFAKKGEKGDILDGLSQVEGVHYYDMPVLTTPPGFAYMLALSHTLFSTHEKFIMPQQKWMPGNGMYTLGQYASKQLYAIIVPLFFSSMLIAFVYLLAKSMFGYEAGIWSAFLMVICPIDILTSQKIWADDMVSFFVALSVFLFVWAKRRESPLLAVLSGVSAGLGATTKATGGFIVFAIAIYHFYSSREHIKKGNILKALLDKQFLAFLVAGFITILPWYGLITKTYGSPWYLREKGLIEKGAGFGWWEMIHSRPWYMYLVNIPVHTPVLFLAYFVVIDLFNSLKGKDNRVLLFLWYAVYLFLLRNNKEGRYMLPAIPAAAILSGFYLHRIREWASRKIGIRTGFALIIAVLAICAFWSVPIARDVILKDGALILFPF
ncbi:MAG: glycosyltransferase family 39 protein [Candidatus Omnitrophota bacterium]